MLRDIWLITLAGYRFATTQLKNMNTKQAKLHDQIIVGCNGFVWLLFVKHFWFSSPWEFYPLLISICFGATYALHRLHRFDAKGAALATPFYSPALAAFLSFIYWLPDHPYGLAVLSILLFSYAFIRHIQQAN